MSYAFKDELTSTAASVETALAERLTVALAGPGVAPDRLIEAMRHGSLDGGKRLRPLLVVQAAGAFGLSAAAALPAGIALELVHCYSLIHDDLPAMDDDDLRRGRPTVHRAYDDATAILAGDALLTEAFALLAEPVTHPDPATRLRLVSELATASGPAGMVGGQMRDIEGETSPLDEAGIAAMHAMKTGALIRAAVRMGAIAGGADAAALDRLTAYAEAAGRAFQLADDILDVTASAEEMGKKTGKDAAMGKQTLVGRLGVDGARDVLNAIIDEALSALAEFGPEADGLRATVRYFGARQS
ncbi:polyprenyl synthetase family protein [Devosia sp.]|uniref:polyprenyl synthetase family protein n=1 Tax=Devosia sp. TaxID=1871048 RepID=UPI003A912744